MHALSDLALRKVAWSHPMAPRALFAWRDRDTLDANGELINWYGGYCNARLTNVTMSLNGTVLMRARQPAAELSNASMPVATRPLRRLLHNMEGTTSLTRLPVAPISCAIDQAMKQIGDTKILHDWIDLPLHGRVMRNIFGVSKDATTLQLATHVPPRASQIR